MNQATPSFGMTRTRLFIVAATAVAVRIFLACGSPDLEESDSCKRRGGSCEAAQAGESPDCPPGQILYLDSCYCCAPPEDAATGTPTFANDTGAPTMSDDAMAATDGEGDADMGESDGSDDGASDATTVDSGSLDARADG